LIDTASPRLSRRLKTKPSMIGAASRAKFNRHCQSICWKLGCDAVAPFDDRDPAIVEQFVQRQILNLIGPRQAIHVEVMESMRSHIFLYQGEGWRRHRFGHAQPSVVLPAPKSPLSTMTSPGPTTAANARAILWVATRPSLGRQSTARC